MRETAEEFFKRIRFDETTESNNKVRKEIDAVLDNIDTFLTDSGFVEGSVNEKELIEFSKEIFDGKVEDYLIKEEQRLKELVKVKVDDITNEIFVQQKKEESKIKAKVEAPEVKSPSNRKRKIEKIVFDIEPNNARVIPPTKVRKVAFSKRPQGVATISTSYNACAPVEDLRLKLQRKRAFNR